MSTVKRGAATYTEVSIQDMENFVKRAFRALNPKKDVLRGEIVFDLFLSDKSGIRVWTSIPAHGTTGADVGADAIRVQFYNFAKQRPMLTGKAPIVKRTQGWRDSLKDRIEDIMELYDDREEYWESR